MAFYDDGGVDFAQQQLEEARKRREKTAKSEDKFSRNLIVLDKILGLGENYINKKADKLETENVLARSHYVSQLEQSNAFNKEHNDYVAQGYTTKDILEFETRELLEGYLRGEKGDEYDISQFSDGINNIAREWASDPVKLEAYQKQVDAHSKIPNMSPQELIEISRQQDAPPRNVAEFFGNSVLKLFKSHDDNTLTEEDRLAKQRKLGGLLGTQFDNVRTAVEEYSNLGNPIDELVTFIENNPNKVVFKNAKQQIVPQEDTVGGRTVVRNYLVTTAMDSNGNGITLGEPVLTTQSTRELGTRPLTAQQLSIGAAKISEYVSGSEDSLLMENYKLQAKEMPTTLTESILTVEDFLINQYGIERNRALGIATKYVVNQDSNAPDTKPSLYDIDFSLGQIDSTKIEAYADSIIKTKPTVFINSELRKLRDGMINVIATSDNERAGEDITAINTIMEQKYKVTNVEEYNDLLKEEADIPQETKQIYETIKNTPIVGDVSEFIFGEEFGDTPLDYITLLPMGGIVFKGTTKGLGFVGGKIAIPLGNQILKHPTMAKFITRATKYADPTKKIRGREMFIKNLNPVEKAVFRSMNAKGNIDTMAFMKRLAVIPGVYALKSNPFPSLGSPIRNLLGYGTLGAAVIYSSSEDKEEPTQD